MNDLVHNHLQERKSSLTALNKNSSRQSLKPNNSDLKNHSQYKDSFHPVPYANHSQSTQKTSSKHHVKDSTHAIASIDSSLAKNTAKVQDQQNVDYIRNLYKKYLGKQNKQSSEKINAYTERKLRTTESREILAPNTALKDFTKRALFKQISDNQLLNVNDKKMLKSRDLNLYNQEHQPHQTLNIQLTSQSRASLKTKKPSSKKNQKETVNEKQKNDPKKYKSKQKVEKAQIDKDHKPQVLQKSQITRLKWPQNKPTQIQGQKRKLSTEVGVSARQEQKVKIKDKVNEGIVHPHRESYTQFDTEQQEGSSSKISFTKNESKEMVRLSRNSQNRRGTGESEMNYGRIMESKILNGYNDKNFVGIQQIELFLGQQNTLLRALKRINRARQVLTRNNDSSLLTSQITIRNPRGVSVSKEGRTLIY